MAHPNSAVGPKPTRTPVVVVTSARGAISVHTIDKTLMNVSNKQEDNF